MKVIKPINYEKIIVKRANVAYENFKANVGKEFNVPRNIFDFFEKNNQLSTREEVEQFGFEFDKTFGEWFVLDKNADKLIILNHMMSIIQNSIIVIMSIDINLDVEKIEKQIITNSGGIDVVAATAVHAFGIKLNELIKKYSELELDQDKEEVFKQLNRFLNEVSVQDTQTAFANLMNNILEFNKNYINSYNRLSKLTIDDLSTKRIELFMEYMNTYYFMVYLLEIVLTYPLNEGMMNQETFDKIMPNIELYN